MHGARCTVEEEVSGASPTLGPGPGQRAGESPGRRLTRLDYLIAALIFALILLEGLHTIHQVGISWDEPFYFGIARGYLDWAKRLGQGGAFSAETLERTFNLNPPKYDSPILAKLIGVITLGLFQERLGDFWAFRLSAPLLFGILLAGVYLRAAPVWGRPAGLLAALCLGSLPRFFTDSHIAATDAPLSVFWFLAVWAFEAACARRRLIPLAGIAYGLVMAVKFTGFLIPLPLIAWALLYRRRTMWWPVVSLILLGPLVFILLEPAIWDHVGTDLILFVERSITRKAWNPRWVLFLGQAYNFSPPWYYAPVMVAVTVPALTLALFLLGGIRALQSRVRDRLAGSCLIHFAFFIFLTMAPNAPLFDGVRLFLPAFVFLGILAGYGGAGLLGWVTARVRAGRSSLPVLRSPRVLAALVAAALALGIVSPLLGAYPYGLEYYNELIGGVKGARERGLETTYWWTVVNESTLADLNRRLPAQAALRFFPMDADMWNLYRRLGLLRQDFRMTEGTDFDYLLVLSRPYWNYGPIFRYVGVPQARLQPVDSLVVDGVPFWVLYQRLP